MSKLAHAGLSSTASPARACSKHQRVASSRLAWSAWADRCAQARLRCAAASRPMSATARAWRASGCASGAKSWPLPSPPNITISLPGRDRHPGLRWRRPWRPRWCLCCRQRLRRRRCCAISSTRCGSPAYSRRPCSIGASGQPMAQASASAASALAALWRPRRRSASAGIRRWSSTSLSWRWPPRCRPWRAPARSCHLRPQGRSHRVVCGAPSPKLKHLTPITSARRVWPWRVRVRRHRHATAASSRLSTSVCGRRRSVIWPRYRPPCRHANPDGLA